MNPQIAAERWAKTWSRAWPRRDAEAIAALYADTAVYRSPAFGDPYVGLAGVRRYLNEELAVEENIECLFGSPIVSGDRAVVEWWASWTERGQDLTYAGVTVLRFDGPGQVIEHRDYDNHVDRREPPYEGW
jgi:ketosteroid isomerase-like protein